MVAVEPGCRIRVAEADWVPDEVRTRVDRRSTPIACVPHGLTVTVARKSGRHGLDAVGAQHRRPFHPAHLPLRPMAARSRARWLRSKSHPSRGFVRAAEAGHVNVAPRGGRVLAGPRRCGRGSGRASCWRLLTGFQLATLPFSIVGGACALA